MDFINIPISSSDDNATAADFIDKIRQMQSRYDKLLAVSVTSRCNLKCGHCGRSCTADGVDLDEALVGKICSEIPTIKPWVKEIGLTGGEPVLVADSVRRLVEASSANGLPVCVMTNGYWAVSSSAAKKLLKSLPGLHAVVMSTDIYHTRFVSLKNVRTAYESAREIGLEARILLTLPQIRENMTDPLALEIRSFAGEDLITQPLRPMGRAEAIHGDFRYSTEVPSLPCTTLGPLVREDGEVIPCCHGLDWLPVGHPMSIGNLHKIPLKEIFLSYRSHPIIHFLRTWGIPQLLDRLKDFVPDDSLPSHFLDFNQCQACSLLCRSPQISEALDILKNDPWFNIQVAVGRFHFINEYEMLDRLSTEMRGCA